MASLLGKVKTDILDKSKKVIGRSILFSAYPVNGFWKFEDSFFPCSISGDARRPENFRAGCCPFLIEFPVVDSQNLSIRSHRIASKAQGLSLFLNAMFECRITMPNNFQNRWLLSNLFGPTHERSQEGNDDSDFQQLQELFSDCNLLPPLKLVNHGDYFKQSGFQEGREPQLPDTLAQLFKAYIHLDQKSQSKFTRAAFWYRLAQNQDSFTAVFLHLIQCIAALLPPAESEEFCRDCNRTFGKGQTQRFVEFLDELVPPSQEFGKARRKLYKLRSDLTHGWDILGRDIEGLLASGPKASYQTIMMIDAYHLARIALVNWLIKTFTQTSPGGESVLPLA